MKPQGRVTIYCSKEIRKGIIDSFSVVVAENKKAEIKKEYERQGYKVVG